MKNLNRKSIIHAFDTGYNKAKITVIDANITTLIAAAIYLYLAQVLLKALRLLRRWDSYYFIFGIFIARHLTSLVVL